MQLTNTAPVRHATRHVRGGHPTDVARALVVSLALALVGAVAASIGFAAVSAQPVLAAVSATPVWIGAPYDGFYRDGTRPGQHGGNQVAFDFYAAAGTTVRIYAAPKNSAYNTQITAHIISSGAGSGNATYCGYYAVVEMRHSGNTIGRVTFSHLAARAPTGQINRWGGTIGKIAALPLNGPNSCYQVRTTAGRHSHIEFRSYGSRPACAHDWGAVSIPATRYQGYIGDYGKAPLSGNRCPSGI